MSLRYPAGRITLSIDPLLVPNAVTSVTATAPTAYTASVAFTAPTDPGGSSITDYSVVQTTGGTVSTGASSPISVTGLSSETSYTFQVWATNAYGAGPIALSNTVTTPGTTTQKAIFAFGATTNNFAAGSQTNVSNLVSNTGVVATNTTGVGSARGALAAAGYGGDKAVFYGGRVGITPVNYNNLVSNTGVVATDGTAVGSSRSRLSAAIYGTDKAIFMLGLTTNSLSSQTNITNLVSNTGVIAGNTTSLGGARAGAAAAGFGSSGQAIVGYGWGVGGSPSTGNGNTINIITNTGVVGTDAAGAGTARSSLAAAGYGTDKAIFGYGNNNSDINVSITNKVSNTGVVATDTTGVGTARRTPYAAGYGSDKAIFGFGFAGTSVLGMTNLVSNTGVVAGDTAAVGTARAGPAAAGYSFS